MGTGPIPLLEAYKNGSDQWVPGIVETIVADQAVLQHLPVESVSGRTLKREVEGSLPVTEYRNVNEDFSYSFGTDDERVFGLAILGNKFAADTYNVDQAADPGVLLAKAVRRQAKSMGMRLAYDIVNGTGTAKDFAGLRAMQQAGIIRSHNPTAAVVTLPNLDDALDKFEGDPPNIILANKRHRRQITNACKGEAYTRLSWERDNYGRRTTHYNDIPIVEAGNGQDALGATAAILPFTENGTASSGSTTSSMYLLRFKDDELTLLLGNGGKMGVQMWGPGEHGPSHGGRIQWYVGLANWNIDAALRYSNIQFGS